MAKTRCSLRLTDVHATADTVGREFKELTDRFGMMCVSRLLPPVVEALEWLEAYVESHQHLQTRVSALQMENDTASHERDQREILEKKNKDLTAEIGELQRQNKCLQMEMDQLVSKNKELSAQLKDYQCTQAQSSQNYLRPRSQSFTPPSPPLLPNSPSSPSPPRPPLHNSTSPHNNHTHPPTPPSQHHHTHPPAIQRVQVNQTILAENKELKMELEELKAEMAQKNTHVSKEMSKELPRYYKEDMMRILSERNKLKEDLHFLKDELEEVKAALRRASGGKQVTTTNGVSTLPTRIPRAASVRSILTESIDLGSYACSTLSLHM